MRTLALAALLASAVPVQAQRAADVPGRPAPVSLAGSPAPLGVGDWFAAETLKFSQSYEASYSAGAGGSLGLGVYTASLRWQPSSKLAGRVDVGVAHSPFGSSGLQSALGVDGDPRVYLRNAELAYRPTENALIHLSIQQSPYGTYAAPYGYGGGYQRGLGYGPGLGYGAGVGPAPGDLFFRDAQ
ncbi:hypothetical protein [Rubrivirga sp. IMCC45206]|uniref:hypothetical protein n=1 Tax=Rubrivirga sp. IMCC45206 TaxID=3391614 RepID=UPI00398FFFF8